MSKYIELAKKLKALADQGQGGEKENATTALNRIMRAHGITMDQIEDPQRDWVMVKVLNEKHAIRIFVQVCMSVIGKNADMRYMRNSKHNKYRKSLVMASAAEGVEIRAKYDFFYKAYVEEVRIFTTAFIQQNDLLPADGGTYDTANRTPEELAELMKMLDMTKGIKRYNYNKQIGTEKEDDEPTT